MSDGGDDLAIDAAWLIWCYAEGYGLHEDRAFIKNWLREPDESLHPDDVAQKARLLALGRDLVQELLHPRR